MNRLLMEKVRSMLSGAGLGQEFWALAVDTACYLKNRSPTSAVVDKTPYEVWSGQNLMLHISEFLVVKFLCMFLRKKGAN